jgi:hypothetical protein
MLGFDLSQVVQRTNARRKNGKAKSQEYKWFVQNLRIRQGGVKASG